MRFSGFKKNKSAGLLRITLLAGFILMIFSGITLTVFFLIGRQDGSVSRQTESFSRLMREYDIAAGTIRPQSDFEHLNRELDRLERRAVSVDSWLSLLKRRRAIANIHPQSMANYRSSAENALEAFPHSQPIIAVAAAAFVKDSGINAQTEEQLRRWLPLITDSNLNSLVLGLHVIMGDFRNPQRANVLPAFLFSDGTEVIDINLAILKTIRGDYRGAASDIQMMLNSPSAQANTIRFAAEFHYDFGDPLRSSEIFSLIDDEKAMVRQADALYIAGCTDIALAIWNILAARENETGLYNLAVHSENSFTATGLLERLAKLDNASKARQFGLIRYSRLFDNAGAISLLSSDSYFLPQNYPYIDLEIAKRHSQVHTMGRQIAETWLLLDRHDMNEELYKWAAWQFYFHRQFEEAGILLDRMEMFQHLNAPWISSYRAVQLMYEGNIDAAENILRIISTEDAPWYVFANMGRVLEASRATARALAQYELAAQKLQTVPESHKNASILQMRIARCLTALNRPGDARRALLIALEYDPENLTARLELEKTF